MITQYQMNRTRRSEGRHVGGRFKAGLLAPVMAHKMKGSESGLLSQRGQFELDPIPGRMMSSITGQMIAVYVPVQAMHALKNPNADYPGSDDVIRAALANGDALFDLETENEITKRLGINPMSIGGTKKVCESARLAYICANNYLRQRLYVNATTLDKTVQTMAVAVLTQTVLKKLNGVLDPEDRVDGAVNLEGEIPVKGIGFTGNPQVFHTTMRDTDGASTVDQMSSDVNAVKMETRDESGTIYPNVFADLGLGSTDISLRDFYQAEKMDALVRKMREYVDANPEQGEEIVTRLVMGLSLDIGRQPFVLYERDIELNANMIRPMDGASLDSPVTYATSEIDFTVPIPRTEFGGVVVTMMALKPDEVLSSQPHPLFTEAWRQDNFAADELAIDPVPVTMKELNADVDLADEDTVALYTGNHGLKRVYEQYGWNRQLDTNDVAAETSIWQLEVPMSVTPDSVLYPTSLPQTPFADTLAEVVTYSVQSALMVDTPLIFGPNPVEELAAIETEDVFEDA